MSTFKLADRLEFLYTHPHEEDAVLRRILPDLLALDDESDLNTLYGFAHDVCLHHMGEGVLLRGIVEFSNHCRNACHYCGLYRDNRQLERYALTHDEILNSVQLLYGFQIRTLVLQSGETAAGPVAALEALIQTIRARYPDLAMTLSVGEKNRETYRRWKAAGADRYLLKIETADPDLYARLHPGMSLQNRIACLETLMELGYQTGCGGIVGLPDQTLDTLTTDLLFYRRHQFQMIGISPLIPHPETPLAALPVGDLSMTLKMIALTRILVPNAHMPATTAMGSMQGVDNRPLALKSGANVVMLNFTPAAQKRHYEIYPGKRCLNESFCAVGCISKMAASVGRSINLSAGHAVYTPRRQEAKIQEKV